MGIRAGILAVLASSLFIRTADAAPLLTSAGETFLNSAIGSPSSFTLVVDKNTPTLNTFWLALEGINGPTLLLAEAMAGEASYLLGAFSPWQFDRNIVVPGPGRGTPGQFYVDDPGSRDALILNLTTNTVLQQTGALAWSLDSLIGINIGRGDLALLAGRSGDRFPSGSATASDQFASGSGLNIFGQPGTTSFSIGRLEAYAVDAVAVPEPSTAFLAGIGAVLGLYGRRRAKSRTQQS